MSRRLVLFLGALAASTVAGLLYLIWALTVPPSTAAVAAEEPETPSSVAMPVPRLRDETPSTKSAANGLMQDRAATPNATDSEVPKDLAEFEERLETIREAFEQTAYEMARTQEPLVVPTELQRELDHIENVFDRAAEQVDPQVAEAHKWLESQTAK